MESTPDERTVRLWLKELTHLARFYGPWLLLPLFFAVTTLSRPPSRSVNSSEPQHMLVGSDAIRASVRAVSLSGDEQYLDVLQSDAIWRRHDAHTGHELWRRAMTNALLSRIAIRSENLAIAGRNRNERTKLVENDNTLWDGDLPGQLPDEAIQAAGWSLDGSMVAAASDRGSLWLLTVADARVTDIRRHDLGRPLDAIDWSPAGDRLVIVTSGRGVLIWDVGQSQMMGQLPAEMAACRDVAWSRDGSRFITYGQDRWVQVWNGTSLDLVSRMPTQSQLVLAAGLSPDGGLAAIADSDAITLWDVESETVAASLIGHDAEVMFLSFDATGHTLFSVDSQNRIIRWSLTDYREIWAAP